MTGDADPMLETDHLDELLETPAPPQPVVVVQYRNRGVPPWVFFSFAIAVIPIALYVYHRTVVERYRVQAAEESSLLARQIKEERALLPLVRDTPVSKAVLPEPMVTADGPGSGDVPGAAATTTETATAVLHPVAKTAQDSGPSPTKSQSPSSESTPPRSAGVVGQAGSGRDQTGPVAAAELGGQLTQEKTSPITTRSPLADPFASLDNPPKPPIPNVGTGLDAGDVGQPGSARRPRQ